MTESIKQRRDRVTADCANDVVDDLDTYKRKVELGLERGDS